MGRSCSPRLPDSALRLLRSGGLWIRFAGFLLRLLGHVWSGNTDAPLRWSTFAREKPSPSHHPSAAAIAPFQGCAHVCAVYPARWAGLSPFAPLAHRIRPPAFGNGSVAACARGAQGDSPGQRPGYPSRKSLSPEGAKRSAMSGRSKCRRGTLGFRDYPFREKEIRPHRSLSRHCTRRALRIAAAPMPPCESSKIDLQKSAQSRLGKSSPSDSIGSNRGTVVTPLELIRQRRHARPFGAKRQPSTLSS